MNFKGNAFSTGTGLVSDSIEKDGRIYFLQSKGASFELRAFDRNKNSFLSVESGISLADACWFFDGGLLELFGTKFTAVSSDNKVVKSLS